MHILTHARKTVAVFPFDIITGNTNTRFCLNLRHVFMYHHQATWRCSPRHIRSRRSSLCSTTSSKSESTLSSSAPSTAAHDSGEYIMLLLRSCLCRSKSRYHAQDGTLFRCTHDEELDANRQNSLTFSPTKSRRLTLLLACGWLLHWTHVLYVRGKFTWYLLAGGQASGGYRVVVCGAQRTRLLRGHHERHYACVCRVSGACAPTPSRYHAQDGKEGTLVMMT
eukprot:COSAG06_NODE_2362_length_7003_cov_15.069815_6_plen_223_part_00